MTETSLQRQMKQIANQQQQKQKQELEENERLNQARQEMIHAATEILHKLASEIAQADERLSMEESSEGNSLGTVIYYKKRTASMTPSFRLSVTCLPDTVEVSISDGNWQQIKGVLGAWADWTDQQKKYVGPLISETIRQSIEPAFLKWYKSAMELPDEHQQTSNE